MSAAPAPLTDFSSMSAPTSAAALAPAPAPGPIGPSTPIRVLTNFVDAQKLPMDYVVRCMFGMSNADFKKFAATINWNKTSQQRAVGFPGFIGNIIKHLDEFDFVQQRTRDGKPKMMPSADKVPELLLQFPGTAHAADDEDGTGPAAGGGESGHVLAFAAPSCWVKVMGDGDLVRGDSTNPHAAKTLPEASYSIVLPPTQVGYAGPPSAVLNLDLTSTSQYDAVTASIAPDVAILTCFDFIRRLEFKLITKLFLIGTADGGHGCSIPDTLSRMIRTEPAAAKSEGRKPRKAAALVHAYMNETLATERAKPVPSPSKCHTYIVKYNKFNNEKYPVFKRLVDDGVDPELFPAIALNKKIMRAGGQTQKDKYGKGPRLMGPEPVTQTEIELTDLFNTNSTRKTLAGDTPVVWVEDQAFKVHEIRRDPTTDKRVLVDVSAERKKRSEGTFAVHLVTLRAVVAQIRGGFSGKLDWEEMIVLKEPGPGFVPLSGGGGDVHAAEIRAATAALLGPDSDDEEGAAEGKEGYDGGGGGGADGSPSSSKHGVAESDKRKAPEIDDGEGGYSEGKRARRAADDEEE